MRAVLDTNVLISGLIWRGTPHRCLLAAEAGLYDLVTAEPILRELHDKLVTKFANTVEEADETVGGICKIATLVSLTGQTGWVHADPDDDKFVDAAIVANADYIVSGDQHLLSLGVVAGVSVITPRQFADQLFGTP